MHPFDLVPMDRRSLLGRYAEELTIMNRGVNLVARSSAARIVDDHVAHCLTLAQRGFPDGCRVVDWGSGGGLPAIPLAICFPTVEFIAVDSIAKKSDAVRIMARRLALDNVTVWNGRAEDWREPVYSAVSRATAVLETLWSWTLPWIEAPAQVTNEESRWPSGLICLKGGDLVDEISALGRRYPGTVVDTQALGARFGRPDWETKYILAVTSPPPTRS